MTVGEIVVLIEGYLIYKKQGQADVDQEIIRAIDAFVDVIKQNDGKIHNRLLESLCKALDSPVKVP
jgi:hypothetical protein